MKKIQKTRNKAVHISDQYDIAEETLLIPSTLVGVEILDVFPQEYASSCEVEIDSFRGGLTLSFPEIEFGNTEVFIPQRVMDPETQIPLLILEVGSQIEGVIDYDEYPELILNQNQVLSTLIRHRLLQFSTMKRPYINLLRRDIQAVVNLISYSNSYSRNSRLKVENAYMFVSPWRVCSITGDIVMEHPLGDYMPGGLFFEPFDAPMLRSISLSLPIQPGSESMAGESNKLILSEYNEIFYQCAGYSTVKVGDDEDYEIYSMFKPASNIASRFKTHIFGDCYPLAVTEDSVFVEDSIVGEEKERDNTLVSALVVFARINEKTGRFLCGEIEGSTSFCKNEVLVPRKIVEKFSVISISPGQILQPKKGKIFLGMSSEEGEEEEVFFYTDYATEVISVEEDPLVASMYHIKFIINVRLESSRIITTTGLKGMVKPRGNLGSVVVYDSNDTIIDQIDVDLITGMNAVKAGTNTIILSQAALAHNIDDKGQESLSSLDEIQINQFARNIGKCVHLDEYGNKSEVLCGLVQVKVTEVAFLYARPKPQKFSPESGRYLKENGYEKLSKAIWEEGVDPDRYACLEELWKILHDQEEAVMAEVDGIPVFTPDDLFGEGEVDKIFYPEDCVDDIRPLFQLESRLLDPSYNRGFYLDLRYRNGGVVRMPSAFLFLELTKQLPDGTYNYPLLLLYTSQMLRLCIVPDSSGRRSIGFLNDSELDSNFKRDHKDNRKVGDYYSAVIGMIYKTNANPGLTDTKMLDIIRKPRLFGIGMKQVAEHKIPIDTVVILNRGMFKKLTIEAGKYYEDHGVLYALGIRNPVLWLSQINSFRVWGEKEFSAHLNKTGISLNSYLNVKFCKNIVLVNPFSAIWSQSDCDGDLFPITVMSSYEANEELARLAYREDGDHRSYACMDTILEEEAQWIEDYLVDEVAGNDKLNGFEDAEYEMYTLPFTSTKVKTNYVRFYTDSIIAKKQVGVGTINLWVFKTVIECWKSQNPKAITPKVIGHLAHLVGMYPRAVHLYIVRGIKHIDGGSSGFDPYMVNNLLRGNFKKLSKDMFDTFGVPLEASSLMAKIFSWGRNTGTTEAVSSYISMLNNGAPLSDETYYRFGKMLRDTFYGSLLEPLFLLEDLINGKIGQENYELPYHLTEEYQEMLEQEEQEAKEAEQDEEAGEDEEDGEAEDAYSYSADDMESDEGAYSYSADDMESDEEESPAAAPEVSKGANPKPKKKGPSSFGASLRGVKK